MSADDFFNEGAPSAIGTIKAGGDRPGTPIGGPIVEIGDPVQQRDVTSGEPAFWPDGNPKMMLPITVQTDLRDPSISDDDGRRTFWVSGNLKKAIGQALRAANAKLAVGGVLHVTFTGFGEAKQRGHNAPRQWTATYTPPAPGQGFFEQPQQAAAAPAPAPQQWQQPQAAPTPAPAPQQQAAPQMSPEQFAAYQAWQAQQAAAQAAAPAPAPAPSATPAQYADYATQMGFGQQAPLPPATDTPPF